MFRIGKSLEISGYLISGYLGGRDCLAGGMGRVLENMGLVFRERKILWRLWW